MSTPNASPVSDFELERLLRGELGSAEAASVHERLRARGEEGRLLALQASDEEILSRYAPDEVAREVRRRSVMAAAQASAQAAEAQVARKRRSPWALSLLGAATAACALWLMVRPAGSGIDAQSGGLLNPSPEHIIVKGDPALHIFRQTAKQPEMLSPQTLVKAGDVLQLRYIASGDRFGFIASVDARGAVSLHLPENGGPAAELSPSGERALPHSYELDNAPGFERFIFVSSTAPFDTRLFAEALAEGKPLPRTLPPAASRTLPNPPAVHITELTLLKETP